MAEALKRRHGQKPAPAVAAATGRPVDTAQRWLAGRAVPDGAAMVLLILAHGPSFLAALAPEPPAWVEEALRAETRRELEAERAAIEAKLADLDAAP